MTTHRIRARYAALAGIFAVATAGLGACGLADTAPIQRAEATKPSYPTPTVTVTASRPTVATDPPASITASQDDPSLTATTPSAPSTRPAPRVTNPDTASLRALAAVTYLAECVDDSLVQRPRSYVLACGDGNQSLDALVWSNWGSPRATATGKVVVNNCEPSCADGKMISYPVKVVASKLIQGEASATYRVLTVTAIGQPPAGQLRQEAFQLPGNDVGTGAAVMTP